MVVRKAEMNKRKKADWLKEDGIKQITEWKSNGLSNQQIAKNMNIAEKTLYNWINAHPEMAEAIDRGIAGQVTELENALYKSALGQMVKEKKVYKTTDTDGKEITKTEVTERYIPPNPTSVIFALKNRAPERWFDRKFVEHSGSTVQTVNHMENLSDDELRKLANLGGGVDE